VDIVTRVNPAAVAELHVRGSLTVFIDVAGMNGWDDRRLAWIAAGDGQGSALRREPLFLEMGDPGYL
jgi:hypothetical protein